MTPLNGVAFEAIARETAAIPKEGGPEFSNSNQMAKFLIYVELVERRISQALKEQYERGVAETEKRLLLSRVETPSNDAILELAKIVARAGDSGYAFADGCYWYRDNLKLVPMNLPSDEMEILAAQEHIKEKTKNPERYAESKLDHIYTSFRAGVNWHRAHIQAALGEKKDGE
jgi:hypothetical protein